VHEHQLSDAVERALGEQRFLAGEVGAAVLDRGAQQAAERATERRPQVVNLLERGDFVFLERQRPRGELLAVLGLRDDNRLAQALEDFQVGALGRGDVLERLEQPGQFVTGLLRVGERRAREPGLATLGVRHHRLLRGQKARHRVLAPPGRTGRRLPCLIFRWHRVYRPFR